MIRKLQFYIRSRGFVLVQVFLLFVLTNILFSDLRCKWDLSRNGRFKLTSSTERILKDLPDKLYIEAYYSSEIPPEYQSRILLVKEILKEIAAVSTELVELRFYDPDKSEKDKERAIKSGVEPQTLKKVEMGSAQVKTAFLGVSLRMGKETEVIPVVFFAEEAEYQILSLVKKMVRREKNMMSGVALLEEQGSLTAPRPGPSSGKDTFGVFMNQVFASEYGPAFPFGINEDELPRDIRVLVVAGSPELTERGKFHLDQFLMRGGKIVYLPKTMDFSLEDNPGYGGLGLGQKGFAQVLQNSKALDEFFSHYGVRVEPEMVLDPSLGMPMGPLVQMEEGVFGRYHYPLWILATGESGNLSQESPFTRDLEVLLLPWASSLTILKENQPDAEFQTIIQTSKNAFSKADYLFIGEKEVFNIVEEPRGEQIPLGIHIRGELRSYFQGKELPQGISPQGFYSHSRDTISESEIRSPPEILVVSSPYIISDLLVIRDFRDIYQGANAPFFLNALDILQGDEDLVASRAKKPAFESLENFSPSEEVIYSILNVLLIPIAIGVFAFFRMRSRNTRIYGGGV